MATAAVQQELQQSDTAAADFPSSGAVQLYTAPTVALQSPAEIQRAMDQFDGEQFLASIMGQALEKWFYSFKISGKEIEGVSAAGAHEFARLRAEQGFAIRFPIDSVRYEETSENDERGIRAMVVARDHRTGMEAIGVAFYPYMEKRKDAPPVFDRMAGRKAMSVAERNAILRLIPEKTIISALKVRARIIAENEQQREEESRAAMAARPEARRITAGQPDPHPGPYAETTSSAATTPAKPQHPNGGPACPTCNGAMWDNRLTKRNPKAPDFKCADRNCEGVIWPPKDGETRDATGTRQSA